MTDRYYPDIVDDNLEMQQAIQRVRELANHFLTCYDDCDCESCLEWPTAIIKALDGEQ